MGNNKIESMIDTETEDDFQAPNEFNEYFNILKLV